MHGPQTYMSLSNSLRIPVKKTKQGLVVLIHHNLVHEYFVSTVSKERPGTGPKMYSLSRQNLVFRAFHPLWIHLAETLYGELGAKMVLHMCIHTISTISSLNGISNDNNTKNTLPTLLQEKYFIILDQSTIPGHINKKQKLDDDSTFVTLNHDRFFKGIQSQWLIKWIETRIDTLAGFIVNVILDEWYRSDKEICEISTEIIKNRLEPGSFKVPHIICPNSNTSPFDLYVDEICFLSRGFLIRTRSDILLFDSLKAFSDFLPFNYLSDLITQRYNPESSRIFRLLSTKHVLDEKQVQKFTMIGLKDAREKIFRLFQDGWIQLQQVPKTPEHIPSRTFYLCKYDLDHARRTLYAFLCKSFVNCMDRCIDERKHNNEPAINILESHAFSLLNDLALIAIRRTVQDVY